MSNAETEHVSACSIDQQLRTAALDRLSFGTGMPPGAVTVDVVEGRISLTGAVDYPFQRFAAVARLADIGAVGGVDNRLTIRPRTGRTVWDEFHGRDCGPAVPRPFILTALATGSRP